MPAISVEVNGPTPDNGVCKWCYTIKKPGRGFNPDTPVGLQFPPTTPAPLVTPTSDEGSVSVEQLSNGSQVINVKPYRRTYKVTICFWVSCAETKSAVLDYLYVQIDGVTVLRLQEPPPPPPPGTPTPPTGTPEPEGPERGDPIKGPVKLAVAGGMPEISDVVALLARYEALKLWFLLSETDLLGRFADRAHGPAVQQMLTGRTQLITDTTGSSVAEAAPEHVPVIRQSASM